MKKLSKQRIHERLRVAINPDVGAGRNARKRARRKENPEKVRSAEKRRYRASAERINANGRMSSQRYRANFRQLLAELKSGPCADCGQCHPPCVMDFDHRPGETKLFRISQGFSKGKDAVNTEVAKCDLVCANCHRVRTHILRAKKR